MTFNFQNRDLPNECNLVGYSWLLEHFNITAPLREFFSRDEAPASSCILE